MVLPNGARFVVVAACVVNAFSCAASVTFNGLAMFIIKKSPSLHKPAFILLFALALTDFITGFLVQPFFVLKMVTILRERIDLRSLWVQKLDAVLGYIRVSSIIITVLHLTAVNFDRFLALHMKTRYRLIVTVKRAMVASVVLWIAGIGMAVVEPVNKSQKHVMAPLLVCLFLILILFIVNSRKLVRQQNAVATLRSNGQTSSSGNHQEVSGVETARYKAILTSLKYCFGAFLISYLPFLAVNALSSRFNLFSSTSAWVVIPVVVTISLTNSAVNPVLYYWKIPVVRSEIRRLLKLSNTN